MSPAIRLHRYSFRDYLVLEEVSTVKHEFLDGEIYAMVGGSVLHAALSAAAIASLSVQLRGRCRVYSSDLRIRVPATGLTSYAGAAVVCGSVETDPENADTMTNPTALVEVLAPATIDRDLGEKFQHYRQMRAIRAVLYLGQDCRQIERRDRLADDSWHAQVFGPGQTVSIDPLGCRIAVDTLYADAGGP